MRKVLFTEKQIKGIIGEDFETYLPNSTEGSETRENSYGTEVTLNDYNQEKKPMGVVTTDKFANSRVCAIPMFRRISEGKVNEENQELVTHSYNLGMNTNKMIDDNAKNNPNDILLRNMSNDHQMKHGTAKKRKHDLEQMKKDDPERFKRINGNKILSGLNQKLNIDRNMSKNHKDVKKNIFGYNNAYQKEGGSRNNVNSRKAKGNKIISYEN